MRKGLMAIGITAAAGLLLSCCLTIIQDPFFVYHSPCSEQYYNFTNEAYQNPGIARNFDYTNIISGSSVTENFNTQYFDEQYGGQTVKLCYSGETLKNKYDILKLAFESKEESEIKNVFSSLDLWELVDTEGAVYNESPQYLMDDNVFNDANYLFNKDVLFDNVIPNLLNGGVEPQEMHSAFKWWGMPYGSYAIFEQWAVPSPWREEQEQSIYLDLVEDNLNHYIIPLVKENPEIDFYFFYPPYSILYWYEKVCGGEVDALFAAKKYVNERLTQYSNVNVYDFQWDIDIITNLWNYKDTIHYGENIQNFIAEQFAESKYLINDDWIEKTIKLKHEIDSFSLSEYNSEILWEIEDIHNYIKYVIEQPQYVVFCTLNGNSSMGWTKHLVDLWKAYGSKIDLKNLDKGSYIMIAENGKIKYEEASEDDLEFELNDDIYIKSIVNMWEDDANITINGVEYSQNGRGINIVVYDKEKKKVVDSVCFDTDNNLVCTRMNGWR